MDETGVRETGMNPNPKPTRIKLKGKPYDDLCAKVKHRDMYTCQLCRHSCIPSSVHHVIFRSQGGEDVMENLLTVCWRCHRDLHDGRDGLKQKAVEKMREINDTLL